MLNGTDMITAALNTWLKKNNFEARCGGMESDFGWNPAQDYIFYSLTITEKSAQMFYEYTGELGLKYELDDFWLAFLHELGHSETWYLVDEEDWDVPIEITEYDYFRHPREAIATEWAVDFINEHPQLVRDLTQIVGPAIRMCLELNKVNLEEE